MVVVEMMAGGGSRGARKAGKEEALGELGLENSRDLLINVASFIPVSALRSMRTRMSVYCCAESPWPYFVSDGPLIISNEYSPGTSFFYHVSTMYCVIRQSYTSISTHRSPFQTSYPTNRH